MRNTKKDKEEWRRLLWYNPKTAKGDEQQEN